MHSKPTGGHRRDERRAPWDCSYHVRFPKVLMTFLKAPKSRLLPLFAATFLALAGLAPVYSGDAVAESEQRLLTDIKYLSSDDLEGRGVGMKGLDTAADYIREQF